MLDGAGADVAVVDFEPPLVAAAAVVVDPVVLADFLEADLALAVEAVDSDLALLVSDDADIADEAADAVDAADVVAATVADALPLGVIDSTVFLLSTTNC